MNESLPTEVRARSALSFRRTRNISESEARPRKYLLLEYGSVTGFVKQ